MKTRMKVSFGINILAVLAMIIGGIQYMVATELNSYHKAVLGVDWDSLADGVKTMFGIFMKGNGTASLVCAASILFLLFIPFRKGENWSRWAMLVTGMVLNIPGLAGALYLSITTGAATPWGLIAGIMILLLAGFFLSIGLEKKVSVEMAG